MANHNLLSSLHNEINMVITAIILVATFYCFIKEKFPAHVTAMAAMSLLLLTQVISTDEALLVFSNSAPITIACMFVLSAALQKTGVIDLMGYKILKLAKRKKILAITLLFGGVMLASAFMNNTPIVIIMAPVIITLVQKVGDYPSKYLIPLSYAAIMGGACTLIGTSTNILVDGVARLHGQPAFSMFEMTYAGLILAFIGSVFLAFFAKRLLPEHQLLESEFSKEAKKKRFLAEAIILKDSVLIGKTLNEVRFTADANYEIIDLIRNNQGSRLRSTLLKALKGVLNVKDEGQASAVIEAETGIAESQKSHPLPNEDSQSSVGSTLRDVPLKAGDRIVFKTNKEELIELNKLIGLSFNAEYKNDSNFFVPITAKETVVEEGVIGSNSDFIGKSPADLGLRRRYGCYIIAIHRDKTNITRNFDDVRFKYGDTIVIEGAKEDLERLFKSEEILGVSQFRSTALDRKKAPIAILTIITVVTLSALNIMPIAGVALIGSMFVILTRCVDSDKVYESIEWKMLMIIFGTLSLSIAMENTGLAELIVEKMSLIFNGLGPFGILAALYIITSLLTEIISNNAAAVLLTPIAIGLAKSFGFDPRPFIVAVMFAASASFATPIGYQTNTYVYNIGNYKFKDFLKIGVAMNFLMMIAATIVIPMFWWFW